MIFYFQNFSAGRADPDQPPESTRTSPAWRDAVSRFREATIAANQIRLAQVDALESVLDAVLAENQPERFFTLSEIAHRTGFAPQTIRNLVNSGALREGEHYFKPTGGKLLFDWRAMENWIRRARSERPTLQAISGGKSRGR